MMKVHESPLLLTSAAQKTSSMTDAAEHYERDADKTNNSLALENA